MADLTIEARLLTGRYVAASVGDRDVPEWPPHPGRLFMAIAATCFERGSVPDEVEAVEWLATLPPPTIHCGEPRIRTAVTAYLCTNDDRTLGKDTKTDRKVMVQATPQVMRRKRARSFPTCVPDDDTIRFIYPVDCATVDPEIIAALDRVCREVIRIGHSSSLVSLSARISAKIDGVVHDDGAGTRRWRPTEGLVGRSLRVATEGEFQRLEVSGNRRKIQRFHHLKDAASDGTAAEKRTAKADFLEEFGTRLTTSVRPPEPAPATIGVWQRYAVDATTEDVSDAVVTQTAFDPGLIVLRAGNRPGARRRLGLPDTATVMRLLRKAVLKHCGVQPNPEWVCGHAGVGQPTRSTHLAFVPLPFVGRRHADGHLLGVGIVPPTGIDGDSLRACLGPVIYDVDADGFRQRELSLNLKSLTVATFILEDRPDPPIALRASTWTGTSTVWESVTPVVLERYPKADRGKNRNRWREEVVEGLVRSCEYAGVPRPAAIDIDTSSFLTGVPPAIRRRRRGGSSRFDDGRSGVGFRPFAPSKGRPPRPQVHVRLRFDVPISGPILLGAGRFLGYGLMRPNPRWQPQRMSSRGDLEQ